MEAFFATAIGTALGSGIAITLLGTFIAHKLTVARETEARAALIREKRREESRAVAEIISEWVRPTYTGKFTNEDRWKLQTIYWKNILGMDESLVRILGARLANDPNAKSVRELLVEARKVLLGLPKLDLSAEMLNSWEPDKTDTRE
jgi:hypothetical protein